MVHRKALREYYLVLGLEPGASLREVKQAHRAGVKRWHPDQFSCDARLEQLAEEKLKEINEAYTALCAWDGQRAGYARYGRPMAGQRGFKTSGFPAGHAGPASGWQYDGSAGIRGFKYQSAYYRRRQAKARTGSDGANPYSEGYGAGPRLTKATIRRWIIVVVVFAILSYANAHSASLLRLVTRSGQARRAHPTQAVSPAPPPRFDVRGVPIVTIVERPVGKFEFPRESSSQFSVLSSQKKQTTATGQQR